MTRALRLSRFSIALVEQALWSLLNFGVNLVLIRALAPAAYGDFAFWANCGFVLASVQNAVSLCHIQVLTPDDGRAPHRLEVERLMHAVNALFLLLVGLVILLASLWLRARGSPLGSPAAALFVPAFLLQQYIRSLVFSRGRPVTATVQTAAVFVLAAAGLAFAVFVRRTSGADAALLSIGGAYGLVGVWGAARAFAGQDVWRAWRALPAYGGYARQSSWIFLGVTTTEILARFYSFVVAARLGPAPLAALSATQLLLRPIPLVASSWSSIARPELAQLREAEDWRGFRRQLELGLAAGLVISLLALAFVYGLWGPISAHLFGGKYAHAGWMVLLWGLSSGLSLSQTIFGVGLQVLRAFKPLALATTAASIAAAVGIVGFTAVWGAAGAISGTVIGQAVELVVMGVLLQRALGQTPRRTDDQPAPSRAARNRRSVSTPT